MPRRRLPYLRWGLAVVFLALGLAAFIFDALLKKWPDSGLALAGGIVVGAPDWPAFWDGILKTEAGGGVAKALSREVSAVERDIRIATGIRPTPLRWSVWLGKRALYSRQGEVQLLCVRPGILLRACFALGMAPTGGDGFPADYRWQDGYLLISHGQLESAAIGSALDLARPDESGTGLVARLPGTAGGLSLRIWAQDGIPVEIMGRDSTPSQADRAPVPLAETAPHAIVDLLLDARGRSALDSMEQSLKYFGLWPETGIAPLPQVPEALEATLPWDRIALERRLLFDVQADLGYTILHVGNSICLEGQAWGRHPFENDAAYPPIAHIPYNWNDVAGFYFPVAGKDYTFGCAIQGPWAHTANPPNYMPELLVPAGAPADVPPSFRLKVDWSLAAGTFVAWYRDTHAKDPGGKNAFELERTLSTWADAIRALGETQLEMPPSLDDGTWRIAGQLARRAG